MFVCLFKLFVCIFFYNFFLPLVVNKDVHIWGEAPRKDIEIKFGAGVDVLEVVTWAEFDLYNLRGVNFTGG